MAMIPGARLSCDIERELGALGGTLPDPDENQTDSQPELYGMGLLGPTDEQPSFEEEKTREQEYVEAGDPGLQGKLKRWFCGTNALHVIFNY